MTDVVEQFYDSAAEYEWHRLERHRTEYGVTLHNCVYASATNPGRCEPASHRDVMLYVGRKNE